MQDIGGKEDTELSKENLTLCWREFSVESLDTVSLLEIGLHLEVIACGGLWRSNLIPASVAFGTIRSGKLLRDCQPKGRFHLSIFHWTIKNAN